MQSYTNTSQNIRFHKSISRFIQSDSVFSVSDVSSVLLISFSTLLYLLLGSL